MADDDKWRMISEDDFISGQTLSFAHQPYLKELFEVVAKKQAPVSIVAGAGVSRDASLPTWHKLIEEICKSIQDPSLRDFALADEGDLMRKAEFVIPMAMYLTNKEPKDVIRDALYVNKATLTPGSLAHAIARLGVALGSRARLVTSNFDDLLELALREYLKPTSRIESVGLDDSAHWLEDPEPHAGKVLHIHGMVTPNKPAVDPVILAESHFLQHGPRVRSMMKNLLETTCVVFTGISVADPNLTGPLWDLRPVFSATDSILDRPFVLIVPDQPEYVEGQDREEVINTSKRYALTKALYLERVLHLRPIFLRSYSQLVQVFWDLQLALAFPQRYRLDNRRVNSSLRYGVRFAKKLDSCYRAIECDKKCDTPSTAAAQSLSDKLNSSLESKGEIRRLLNEFRENAFERTVKQSGSRSVGRNVFRAGIALENFGLFLWLRSRSQPKKLAPYCLQLVGTSVYTHRDAWSNAPIAPIDSRSKFPAANTAFYGSSGLYNLDRSGAYALWKGMLAVPVRLEELPDAQDKPLDVVTLGVITLNTTEYATKTETVPHPESLLAKLTESEIGRLCAELEHVARKIVTIA